jgi:pilus assembly protein Flp/PilA
MMNSVMQFVREEEGATALEYGLLAALIAAAIVTAVTQLGTTVSDTFDSIATDMAAATGGS